LINSEQHFFTLQDQLRHQPTSKQSQTTISAATADIDNDSTEDNTTERKHFGNNMRKDGTNPENHLIVLYTYEKRSASLARNIHRNYGNVFKNTSAMGLKLLVGNRNRRDTKIELIYKRPKRLILQSKQIRNKYFKFLGNRSLF
jgi:hypothetical protein